MKSIIRNLFVPLASLAVVLLLVDIAVHVWFGNRYHLKFDDATFNNVVTPIVSVITAIAFVYISFNQNKLVLRQNKIIISQGLKPYYEQLVKKLIAKFKKTEFKYSTDDDMKYNGINWTDILQRTLHETFITNDYEEDLKDYQLGNRKPFSYYRSRSYFSSLNSVDTILYKMEERYKGLRTLEYQITNSNLIGEDIEQLNRKIHFGVLEEFFKYYAKEKARADVANFSDEDGRIIPILFDGVKLKNEVTFKNILECERMKNISELLIDPKVTEMLKTFRKDGKDEKLKRFVKRG